MPFHPAYASLQHLIFDSNTVYCNTYFSMHGNYTVDGLAAAVNGWCEQHGIAPASGQSGERVTVRNIRYYRTLGLVDAPMTGGGAGYGEKHLLQLLAIRLLQAQGLPLNRVRDLLYGRTLDELREVRKRGLEEVPSAVPAFPQSSRSEAWRVTPLDGEFLIISRHGRALPESTCARLRAVLQAESDVAAKAQSHRH